jgi:regulator of RNase E activity RraA
VGVVTNGSVRSIPAAERASFHLFSGGLSVSHAYVHIIEIGTQVEIGGLKIRSGDLLHGDVHGVQSIPLGIAAHIPPIAARITARKRELIALCQSPEFSLEKLRTTIAKGG